MKKLVVASAFAAGIMLAGSPAQAFISIGFGNYGGYYSYDYYPAYSYPVYSYPVYAPPVYYAPPPVYYAPPVYYGYPAYGYSYYSRGPGFSFGFF